MSEITLFSYWQSSCSWRVRAALAYKGINYKISTVNLSTNEQTGDYKKMNPKGQVPALVVDGKTIVESVAILEYLEEAHPNNPLLPKDLFQRAKVREVCEIMNAWIQPLHHRKLAQRHSADPKEQSKFSHFFLNDGLKVLEEVVSRCCGKYTVGDELSFADCFLVPMMYNAKYRFKVDLSQFPTLVRLDEFLLTLNLFANSHPYKQPDYVQ